jgi:hypothetical protein
LCVVLSAGPLTGWLCWHYWASHLWLQADGICGLLG